MLSVIIHFSGFCDFAAGISVGFCGLAAGYAIGIVGDAGVRGMSRNTFDVLLFMVLILSEVELILLSNYYGTTNL